MLFLWCFLLLLFFELVLQLAQQLKRLFLRGQCSMLARGFLSETLKILTSSDSETPHSSLLWHDRGKLRTYNSFEVGGQQLQPYKSLPLSRPSPKKICRTPKNQPKTTKKTLEPYPPKKTHIHLKTNIPPKKSK